MIRRGIVKEYNNDFGIIQTDDNIVDFDKKDLSFDETIKVGDLVEFREEIKAPFLSIARNIIKINE